ncbi:MAG: hypothetical protein IT209_00885 [Armatimonadetes bacterium]|nr:hypothetical protein [Armatimonadota bacterium]
MIYLRVPALTVVAALLLSTAALAQQTDEKAVDPRLDQKVSLDVTYAKLSDVAELLSKQSGVSIRAGSSERDWRVRERHISVRAKDVRLGDLLDNISNLVHYRLARGKRDGQFTYLWWQDKNQRDLEAEMLTAQKAADAERTREQRQAAFELSDRALTMSEADARKLRDKDPWLSYLGATPTGRAYAQLLKGITASYPDVKDLLLRGRRATIDLNQAPVQMREAARQATETSMFRGLIENPQHDPWKSMRPSSLTVMPLQESADGVQHSWGFGGMIMIMGRSSDWPAGGAGDLTDGMPMGILPITGEGTVMGHLFGRLMWMLEDGVAPQDAQKKLMEDFRDSGAVQSLLAHKSPTEDAPPVAGPLLKEVEVKKMPGIQEMSLDVDHSDEKKTLDLLAKATGGPVILESYLRMMLPGAFISPGKQALAKMVIAFEKAGYEWDLKGDTLTLRPEDWSVRRSCEIRESWLEYYRNKIQTNGSLTLDELADMAAELSDGQIHRTLMADPDFVFMAGNLSSEMGGPGDLLRLYGALTPQQKKALSGERGLTFADLNDGQYQRLADLMIERLGGVEIADGFVRIVKDKTWPDEPAQQPAIVRFECSVLTTTDDKPRTFQVAVMLPDAAQMKRMRERMRKMGDDLQKKNKSEDPNAPPAEEKTLAAP